MNRHELTIMDTLKNTIGLEALCTETIYLLNSGWDISVVRAQRGFCTYEKKTITIPLWAIEHKDPDYKYWYLAHEVSHAIAGPKVAHGPDFMQILTGICPKHVLHYELEYKLLEILAAKKAGIMPADF